MINIQLMLPKPFNIQWSKIQETNRKELRIGILWAMNGLLQLQCIPAYVVRIQTIVLQSKWVESKLGSDFLLTLQFDQSSALLQAERGFIVLCTITKPAAELILWCLRRQCFLLRAGDNVYFIRQACHCWQSESISSRCPSLAWSHSWSNSSYSLIWL